MCTLTVYFFAARATFLFIKQHFFYSLTTAAVNRRNLRPESYLFTQSNKLEQTRSVQIKKRLFNLHENGIHSLSSQ